MDQWEEEVLLWLVILRTIPMDSPEVETSKRYGTHDVEDLLSKVTNIIYNFGDFNPCYQLHLFMRKFDLGVVRKELPSDDSTRLMVKEHLFSDDYPKTDPLGFYDHLLRTMEEFVMEEDNQKQESHDMFNFVVNYFCKKVETRLKEFRFSFKDMSDLRKEWVDHDDIKTVMTWITSLLYEVEYVLDSLLSKQCPRFESAAWLGKVLHRLPEKILKDKIDRIIEELNYSGSPSMEVGSKESIMSYVLSTYRHQIIPIINFDDEDIGETFRGIFIDDKIVSRFKVSKWRLKRLSESVPHLMGLSPREFNVIVENLAAWTHKFFVIFENVSSELQFKRLQDLMKKSRPAKASKILYTTREAELARKCRLNSPKIFYIPSKTNYNTADPTTEREVVGFNKETEEMIDWLTRGGIAKSVISISGMPGIGKTTLAKLLYKHPSVTQHFHVRAFCTVSQVYILRELFLQLLGQFFPTNVTFHGLEDIELAALICKSLRGLMYLLVLDDIWDIDAWNAIMICFPDDKNGSRIIITTRQTELMPLNIQSVNLLSETECWELLEKEIFQDQNCPEELTTIGKTIARNCKGLPLSVILIAGFLKKLDRPKAAWQKVAETLTSGLDTDAEAQRKCIMELSYKHLPDCLQPCFLYFGIFPEDNKIPAEKLIRLWSAEGFLLQEVGDDTKGVEDIAASYLMDLAGRSLVTLAEKNLSGRVKSYQVHDLIREFCITKAKEEKFFLKLSGQGELSAYLKPLIENNLEFNELPIPSGPRRLAINCERKQLLEMKLSTLPLVRSMLFLADKSNTYPQNIYNVSFIYDYFKLLKILDLEEIIIGDSSLQLILKLVLLKYLAVKSDADQIPGEISKLWNLETLVFKSSQTEREVLVPDSFWDMTKLRHVHISGKPDFDLDLKRVENTLAVVPGNLQTFSTPSLSIGGKLEQVLPRLRNIKKLKCRFTDQFLDVAGNGQLPMLDFLSNLESLNVVYSMERSFEFTSGEFKFPDSLTKLTLSNFCMPWKEISQLTKLKVLEVLKIQNRAFKGETWDMSDQNEFEKLKVLKLEALDIVNWCGVSEDHFPKLKHLLLCNLENLEEIPDGVGELNTLEMIDVKWCNSSVEKSAKRIKEDWDEYGNEINIIIHSKAREIGTALDEELESAMDNISELALSPASSVNKHMF